MSYGFQYKALVYPVTEVTDPSGNTTVYSGSSYPSGYYTYSGPEAVRRKRPNDLKAQSSLTGWGTLEEETMIYGNFTLINHSSGYTLVQKDVNAQWYLAVGRSVSAEDPEWETALRLAVKDQKVNLAQAMGEYRQTQKLFADNASTIAKALRQLKRGDGRGAARLLGLKPKQLRGTLSNRWLELQYGWKPLLQDLHGSVEELKTAMNRPRYRQVSIRKVAEAQNERSAILPDGRKAFAKDSDKVVIKATAIVLMQSLTAQRLGFTNPAALAWELLPYSFVIDWFIPIGNWLNSLDALVGVDQCYGFVTRKSKYISASSLGGYYLRRTYGRSVFDSLPGSRPTPKWDPSLGFGRVTNALALLSQLKR